VDVGCRVWAGNGLSPCRGSESGASLLRRSLELDPRNFTVRKQIWREEFPERSYPTIDTDWQKEQLTREGYAP
jgi:hypothetical protein